MHFGMVKREWLNGHGFKLNMFCSLIATYCTRPVDIYIYVFWVLGCISDVYLVPSYSKLYHMCMILLFSFFDSLYPFLHIHLQLACMYNSIESPSTIKIEKL